MSVLAHVLIDDHATKRLQGLLRMGLIANPFKWNDLIDQLDPPTEMIKLLWLFMHAYANAKKVFYISKKDFEKLSGLPGNLLSKGVEYKVLKIIEKDNEIYYGLSDIVLEYMYSVKRGEE